MSHSPSGEHRRDYPYKRWVERKIILSRERRGEEGTIKGHECGERLHCKNCLIDMMTHFIREIEENVVHSFLFF